MEKLKVVDDGKYRKTFSVYACKSDTVHDKVIMLASRLGFLSKDRYEQLKGLNIIDRTLEQDELVAILTNFFGFEKGFYEEHLIEGWQKGKLGGKCHGEVRYTGSERLDKEWIESGLASQDAVEKFKFGSVISINDEKDLGDLGVEDALNSYRVNNEY